MALKAKKEILAPPKAKAKTKKAALKGIHGHKMKKEDPYITHLPVAQNTVAQEGAQISPEECPWEKHRPLCHQVPSTSKSATKTSEDTTQLVFTVDVKANQDQSKQAVKTPCDINMAKANTLIRPEGGKKAYVQLAPDYDASDAANKIGII